MPTPDHFVANFKLIGDLYMQIEQAEAQRDAVFADLNAERETTAELRSLILEKDQRIAELHDHIAVLERPARVPSGGNPPL